MEQSDCKIREITAQDFDALMQLYTHLHSNPIPEKCDKVAVVWQQILTDSAHHIIVAEIGGSIEILRSDVRGVHPASAFR